MRRLLTVASLVIFVDVAFFEAITPLLAGYRNDLDLGEGAAGLLVGSYAVGSVLASLPVGYFASRWGPRRLILVGLVFFGAAGAAFGLMDTLTPLVVTRFIQGAAGAALWAGAMTWMINSAPLQRRGAVIGIALGMAVAGALFGPAFGAIASEIGTEVVFSGVAVLSAILFVAALTIPDVTIRSWPGVRTVGYSLTRAQLLWSVGMVSVPSTMFGVVAVLVPLQIDDLGGSSILVAVGFAGGAAVEASLSPLIGRYSDRHGRFLPFAVGTGIGAVAIMFVPAASIPLVLGALIGAAVAAGMSFAPASARLSDSADTVGLHQGFATAMGNMAWAIGQVVGSVAGGAIAELSGGPLLPCILTAALMLTTSLAARRKIGVR